MKKFLLMCLCMLVGIACAEDVPHATIWEIKYILFLDTVKDFRRNTLLAKRENAEILRQHQDLSYLNSNELLTPTITLNKRVAIALIKFDRVGNVINQTPLLLGARGMHGRHGGLVLAKERSYYFEDWEVETEEPRHFLPAPCTQRDHVR